METVHRVLSVFGAFVTLLGTAAAAWGTYFLAKRYYSTTEGFRSHLLDYPYLAMLLSRNIADEDMKPSDREELKALEIRATAAEVNTEKTSISLVGFQLVFIGFLLQLFGGALVMLDAVLPRISSGAGTAPVP